jgi:subtilase family serine protease
MTRARRAAVGIAAAAASAAAVLAPAGLASAGPGSASSGAARISTTGRLEARAVRPLPLGAIRPLDQDVLTPPTMADCLAQIGTPCYSPGLLEQAYDLKPLFVRGLTGAGSTIVIVDPFGSPTIAADLRSYDQAFGLPDPPSFRVIAPVGPIPPYPTGDPAGPGDRSTWAGETTIDVESAHAMAPGANILLVETPVPETQGVTGFPELVAAENYVIDRDLGGVISQSFGAGEETFPSPQSILGLRSAFVNAALHDVTVLAGSGDSGSTAPLLDGTCCSAARTTSWPATDPLVTAVGGTQVQLDAAGNRLAPDSVFNDVPIFGPDAGAGAGGGGQSSVFSRPAFQDGVAGIVGAARGTPDISMSASADDPLLTYSSYCFYSPGQPPDCTPGFGLASGTSEATQLFAGIVAIADQAAGHWLGWLNPTLYAHAAGDLGGGIVDVTSGNNTYTFCQADCGAANEVDTTVPGYDAGPGYDMASGLGTIDAAQFVAALSARPTTTIAYASPPISTLGTPVTLTATVIAGQARARGPGGSVSFYLDGNASPAGTVALTGDQASFRLAGAAAGAHSVTAVYSGSTGFAASTSPASRLFVIARP